MKKTNDTLQHETFVGEAKPVIAEKVRIKQLPMVLLKRRQSQVVCSCGMNRSHGHFEQLRSKFKMQNLVNGIKLTPQVKPDNIPQADSIQPAVHDFTRHDFDQQYELGEVIGQGANAVVKRCIRKQDGEEFAVKISEVEEEHLLFMRKLFNTVFNLKLLNHRNMLVYNAIYVSMRRRACYLVMDYLPYPNLSDVIHSKSRKTFPLKESEIKQIMWQLLDTIRFLHSQGICHRDIKPENILYDRKQGRIWLIDLGVCKIMSENNVKKLMMTNTGTIQYKAPEMLEGGLYTEGVDEWAAGIVLYEMIEGRLPFSSEYLTDTIKNITEIEYQEGEVWHIYSKYAKDLLHRLLRPIGQRLNAQVALNAPWFLEKETTRVRAQSVSHARHSKMDDEGAILKKYHQPLKIVSKQTVEHPIMRKETVHQRSVSVCQKKINGRKLTVADLTDTTKSFFLA